MIRKLSIIIPAYNEVSTIANLLDKVREVELIDSIEKELVIVDDHSSDNTVDILKKYKLEHPDLFIVIHSQSKNQGKGAAVHKGIQLATGDYMIVQDADLEYEPQEYNLLLQPVLDGLADVVYGSRFTAGKPHRAQFFMHSLGNRFLTALSNLFTNLQLTDMETCYKLIDLKIAKRLYLREKRFGFEPEVTAKLSRVPNIRIYEVGISYYGRNYTEGKKIGWQDAIRAIYCILKYNIFYRRIFRY